ncbi:MAG: metallophosphoesterase [Candidatus Omnitrophica bacterium]|nr:metallophosphoesterase [Candidatus Omnitrophota bacterium]
MRTIIFGDIHGCYEEWQELLGKVGASDEDTLISVGDLVCKGPYTKKVLDLAMSLPNLKVVMGNHDLSLLKRWQNRQLDSLTTEYQQDAVRDMGAGLDNYMNFIAGWPYYIEHPDYLVVHAGLRPGIPVHEQCADDLVRLRTVEPEGEPWWEFYTDPKLVVHGHWAAQGLVVRENVIGLDSGCVYGKRLSAVILPERQIVSVPARRAYQPII